jgi:thymidine phosphorylase
MVGILEGREAGATHDVVVLNAAAALVLADRAQDLREGVALAAQTIASGAAREQLERLRRSAETSATAARGAATAEAPAAATAEAAAFVAAPPGAATAEVPGAAASVPEAPR